MSEYDNTNTGILFKNDVGDNPKRPVYRGNIDINGAKYDIAGWVREGKNGKKFISLKVEEPKEGGSKPRTPEPKIEETDDIPF